MVSPANNTGGALPLIPSASSTAPSARADALVASAIAPSAAPVTPTGDTRSALPETVPIKSGDTISQLAARYQIPIEQLKAQNPSLFQDGTDSNGKKRAADGRFIYPGDTVRLRAPDATPIDPAKTTIVSNKVVTAAKQYLDQAAIVAPDAAGGRGREVSQKVVDSSQKMLSLIPGSDPERSTYENKVAKLIADFNAQYATPGLDQQQRFKAAGDAFNTAVKAYEDASRVAGQLPSADIQAFQADALQRAVAAYTDAAQAVGAMPDGPDKDVANQQLQVMAFALTQIQQPATPAVATPQGANGVRGGGDDPGTQQPIGQLPASDPNAAANQTPAAIITPAVQPLPGPGPNPASTNQAGSAQSLGQLPGQSAPVSQQVPMTPAPAAQSVPSGQGQPGPDGTITYSDNSGTYTQRPGEIAVYTAKTIDSYSAQPTQGSGQASGTPGAPGNPGSNGAYSPVGSATSPNGANGNNGANGANNPNRANGTDPASNKPKKDPNDPNVQKLWDYLKHADHKAVRDLVSSNFDMFYASLPEQKALMMKILIDGRTTGEDQACMAQIADMSRQQGESDAMIKELNRLFGGDPKGVQRMLEDCKQGARDQILQALFGDPPQGVTYDPGFYNSLISVMTKKDVEHLCQTLGLSPGAPWLARIPSQLQAALANKLNSFWSWLPFNKSKSFKSALINAIQSSPNSASQSPSGQRSSGAQPSAGQQAGQQAGQNAGAKTPAQAGGGNNQAPQQQQQPAGPSNPWDLQDGKRDYPVLAARYHLFNTSANVDAFCNEMKGYETNGALGPGSTNTQSIQALQGALARLGYQVQATGSYDQQTIAAVVAFKQAAGLHQSYVGQDGRPAVNEWADPTTLNAIQQRAGGQAAAR